ncbi:ABC transporter ATP-binding protein [Solirubrobacter soli]|uniref:ABC transporter ATP-binding protein n=1 Tax=Solirubrobacter soli TaxID=363832 RepID=UPI0003F635BB|nr:ABC transporter ATP-binding protein [Solirubrobacter soli]
MLPAIEIDSLRVQRGGRTILHGIDFTIPPGTVCGLLGPSGCGKTTLIRSIVGVQKIAAGTVTVLGEPAGSARLRSRVAYVTQAPSIYSDLTVAANLRYFASILDVPATRAKEALDAVGLADRANDVAGNLSGGQRGRVSLACALLAQPDLLVLDEPTVGLDPVLRRDLWGLFHDLAKSGTTLLVSSHVMDEAEQCDRLILMRDGMLIADAAPSVLRKKTGARDVEQAFLHLVAA